MKAIKVTTGCLAALSLGLFANSASAALYAYDAFAIMNTGGANTYYDLDLATDNPDFVGSTFTITQGDSLLLGGQVRTNPGSGESSWGAEWAYIYYKIDSGNFSSLNLPAISGTPGTDWYVQFEQANVGSMAEIGSSLSAGTHTLQIYFRAHDDTQPWDAYVSNNGNNYSATIQVNPVPEPASIALGVFGGLLAVGYGIRRGVCKMQA